MKVLVLMSVYNGEKYLAEQIESILNQKFKDVDILIRDDGSSDHSEEIIKQYMSGTDRITYIKGVNAGVWKSFMELIYSADESYDYYAFSDQDDVWLPEKISVAVEKLQEMGDDRKIPLLYGGNIHPVNEQLQDINTGIKLTKYTPSFGSALIQGITSGLTCVFNRELLLKIRKNEKPQYMIMHDWWVYLVASCYGKVYYDDNAYVLYRQHGDNVCGARTSRLERVRYRLEHYNERRKSVYNQTKEFLRCNQDMPEDKRRIAQLLCDSQRNFRKKIEYILSKDIRRQKKNDNVVYKILVLFGYL